jgi:hypothetical protein
MANNWRASGTVNKEIERYSRMKVQEYTSTLYDDKGKLVDDGIDLDTDHVYWETFIDPKQARELERRLALIESEDFDWQNTTFTPMEDEDA